MLLEISDLRKPNVEINPERKAFVKNKNSQEKKQILIDIPLTSWPKKPPRNMYHYPNTGVVSTKRRPPTPGYALPPADHLQVPYCHGVTPNQGSYLQVPSQQQYIRPVDRLYAPTQGQYPQKQPYAHVPSHEYEHKPQVYVHNRPYDSNLNRYEKYAPPIAPEPPTRIHKDDYRPQHGSRSRSYGRRPSNDSGYGSRSRSRDRRPSHEPYDSRHGSLSGSFDSSESLYTDDSRSRPRRRSKHSIESDERRHSDLDNFPSSSLYHDDDYNLWGRRPSRVSKTSTRLYPSAEDRRTALADRYYTPRSESEYSDDIGTGRGERYHGANVIYSEPGRNGRSRTYGH